MAQLPENTKTIPGFPDYRIGEDGVVWSSRKLKTDPKNWEPLFRRLKSVRRKTGHLCVTLYDGKRKHGFTKSIHCLVLEAFVSPCPAGMECRHYDGNPSNNHKSNLLWGTHSENQLDRRRHGTAKFGKDNPMGKLTTKQVEEIRSAGSCRSDFVSQRQFANKFGVSQLTISNVRRGKHNTYTSLTECQVKEILNSPQRSTATSTFLANKYGVSVTHITAILKNRKRSFAPEEAE